MAILFVPGFMTDRSLWDDVIRLLGTKNITYCDLDRAGSVEEAAHVALANAPEQFLLVGFSMGGYVAREIARLAPERVSGLVLIATSSRADTNDKMSRKKAVFTQLGSGSVFRGLSRSSIVESLAPSRSQDNLLIEHIRSMSDRLGREVFIRQLKWIRDSDADRLKQISCRTIILAGGEDRLRSIDESRELCQGIDGAEMLVLEGSGHMLPLEAPFEVSQAIESMLKSVKKV